MGLRGTGDMGPGLLLSQCFLADHGLWAWKLLVRGVGEPLSCGLHAQGYPGAGWCGPAWESNEDPAPPAQSPGTQPTKPPARGRVVVLEGRGLECPPDQFFFVATT